MNRAHSARIAALAALIAAMALTTAASASPAAWKWRNADGRIVYSDLPPPPGARVILLARPASATGASSTTPVAPAATEPASAATELAPAAASAAPATAPTSWVERDRVARKQAQERTEAEQRQADETRQKAERDRACTETRDSLRTLQSGIRLHTVNARGEREVVSDAERLRRLDAANRTLAEHCGQQG